MNKHITHNYTPSVTHTKISPELRDWMARLSASRRNRAAQIEDLLDRAHTDHQTAKLFLADRGDSSENIRHWCEECVAKSYQAILWTSVGFRPSAVPMEIYPELLAAAGVELLLLPEEDWLAPCTTKPEAQQRVGSAKQILEFARAALAKMRA